MSSSGFAQWVVRRFGVLRIDWPLAVLDAVWVSIAYAGVTFLRFDGAVPPDFQRGLARTLPLIAVIHLVANAVCGLYGRVWQQASVEEARRVVSAAVLASTSVLVLVRLSDARVPLLTVITGGGLSLLLIGGARFQARMFTVRRRRMAVPEGEPRLAVIVGAGPAARVLLRSIHEGGDQSLRPVAVVDPDPRLHGRTLGELPILGGLEALGQASMVHGAKVAVLTNVDSADLDVALVAKAARAAGLELKVLPGWPELLGNWATVRDLRDLEITDLLGRQQVAASLDDVRGMLRDRRVLITGGGGSIGSEIARQVASFQPAALLVLDNDETHLHDAMAALPAMAEQVLADVRDRQRIDSVFEDLRPDIVFHAAAHKHVPVLENHPCEAVKTNVLGTHNVVRAAAASGVNRFVFISTDKAVQPVNVMGATKRLGEQILLTSRPDGACYAAVRFGNVLGSRGSVVPIFMRQIRGGGPITVTHPDVTRFFMSIPEAVHLVLHAAAQSTGGELFMLDMGSPVKIVDLARRMIELSGRHDVKIEFTGLRAGEKLAEELSEPDEDRQQTRHPSVFRLQPVLADQRVLHEAIAHLEQHVGRLDRAATIRELFALTELLTRNTIDLTGDRSAGAGSVTRIQRVAK